MRVERDILIDASCEEIWEPRLEPGQLRPPLARADLSERKNDEHGLGARYALRMRVGSADGGLIEIVEWDDNAMAWTSITGIDHRALAAARGGRRPHAGSPPARGTRPEVLGSVADRVAAPMAATTLEKTLKNLALELEDEEVLEQVADDGKSLPAKVAYELGNVKVLIDAA